MTRPMVRFGRPSPQLRPYVSTYYVAERALEDGRTITDLFHPEWPNLRYVLRGRWTVDAGARHDDAEADPRLEAPLYGPTSRAMLLTSGGGVALGAGLVPAGWARLIDRPASKAADQVIAQEEVFGREAVLDLLAVLRAAPNDDARFAALDGFLLRRLETQPPESPLVAQAHAILMQEEVATVEDFAARLGVSQRQAQRLSLQHFGFAPKLLLRRQRFLRTLSNQRANLNRPWGSLIDPLYYDQAQYVRDFHDFIGMSPSSYFALSRELLEPAARARIDMFGQPFQALHPVASASAGGAEDRERV